MSHLIRFDICLSSPGKIYSVTSKMKNFKVTGSDDIPDQVLSECEWSVVFNCTMYMRGRTTTSRVRDYQICDTLQNQGFTEWSNQISVYYIDKSFIQNVISVNAGETKVSEWEFPTRLTGGCLRKTRGCRDNSFILRTIGQRVIQLGRSMTITFVLFYNIWHSKP